MDYDGLWVWFHRMTGVISTDYRCPVQPIGVHRVICLLYFTNFTVRYSFTNKLSTLLVEYSTLSIFPFCTCSILWGGDWESSPAQWIAPACKVKSIPLDNCRQDRLPCSWGRGAKQLEQLWQSDILWYDSRNGFDGRCAPFYTESTVRLGRVVNGVVC